MPQFFADLDALFGQRDFMQRFAAAAQAGFDGVEFMFRRMRIRSSKIAHQLCSHALQLVQLSLPAGDWSAGERGIAFAIPSAASSSGAAWMRRYAMRARSACAS